jgi:PAS domain S-box-containing protein
MSPHSTASRWFPTLLNCLFAIAATGGALAVAVLLPYHGRSPVLVLFTLAILASTWVGGVWIGFFAWTLSLVGVLSVLILPGRGFAAAAESGDLFRWGSNLVISALGVLVVARLRAGSRRDQELLLREQKRRAELEQVQAALRYQLELTQAITEGAADAIFVTDPSICVTFVNQEAVRVFGFSREELLGQNLHSTIHHHYPDGRLFPQAECKMTQLFGSTGGVGNFDDVFYRKDGRPVHVSCSTAPVETNGRRVGAVLVVRDITERKQTEEALLRSEKMTLAGRMAASIVHEISNPLAAVTNILYLARSSTVLPEATDRYLEMADGELTRISHITRQALGFYRESTLPATVPASSILDSAIGLLTSKIKGKQVTVEKQCDDTLQLTVMDGELRQVFCNLIANSLDAVDNRGTIKLRISTCHSAAGKGLVRMSVADNGSGIGERTLRHLFEPFHTTKGSAGTGLGLWVSKQLVERCGGSIHVRSRTHGTYKGTTFTVLLPTVAVTPEKELKEFKALGQSA